MIVQPPSPQTLLEWQGIWNHYRNTLRPNRKSGKELLDYLQSNYPLTEIRDPKALSVIEENVMNTEYLYKKLPSGKKPLPRCFYLENIDSGQKFYRAENQDSPNLWGSEITRIFVGIDLISGFYQVEGSTLLWDELCAFQGLDQWDLKNYVLVAQYINALKRIGKAVETLEK